MAYKIVNQMNPSMYKYNAPYAMNPIEICIHNTANTATARNEVTYMNRTANYTSYHVAIDDKEAVQAIPFNRNAFAAGDGVNGRGNRRAIHIEICYSLDGGNNGHQSARYLKAEENAALYTAHVLHQYGWGVDKVKKHQDYSGKYCPHVILANGKWQWFKNRVQAHLNALKKGSTASKPAAKKTASKPATTTKPKAPAKKPAAKKPANSNSGWKTNTHGTQWKKQTGVWINGNQPITKRRGSPSRKAPSSGQMPRGQRLDYREIARADGHIWLLDLKSNQWVPVKTWNSRTGAVGKDWGTWK